MTDDSSTAEVSRSELQAVVGFAVACARTASGVFERVRPEDQRPRAAIDVAQAFAEGGERTKALRDAAWAAHRAAQETRDAGLASASAAARAAADAAGAAFLHPLRQATQVRHVLGSAAHAARALELEAGEEAAGENPVALMLHLAPPAVVDVLRRYPAAPPGGGRVGELVRRLDALLR